MSKILMPFLLILSISACTVHDAPEFQTATAPEDRITIVATGELDFLGRGQQTFGLHPQFAKVRVDEESSIEAVQKQMSSAIQSAMQAKGYRYVPAGEPAQLLIGFGVALGDSMSDAEILNKVGLVPGVSEQGIDMGQYAKGSVLLLVFSGEDAVPSWRVLAQGFTELSQRPSIAPKQDNQRLDRVVAKMLASMPQR